MNVKYIEEPALEFGCGQHIDIRRGITDYGPFDIRETRRPDKIQIGLVGTVQSTDNARRWLEQVSRGVAARESRKPNLFPAFPGFTPDSSFRSSLNFHDSFLGIIPPREFAIIGGYPDPNQRRRDLADIFVNASKRVHEKGADVVVIAYPLELFPLLGESDGQEDHSSVASNNRPNNVVPTIDLHDLIKCKAMLAKVPVQIIRPATCDTKLKRKETDDRGRSRQLQDEATCAWNILIGIYYKAGGIPWRIPRAENALDTFFLGVGFYRSLDRASMHTSVAQVFNERGYGIIVRGGQAARNHTDRQVHLARSAIKDLVVHSLKAYRCEHHHEPARLVIHKTSQFDKEETAGVMDAASALSIDYVDVLSLAHSSIRLFRNGYYPPLRGTALDIDDKQRLLYTRGTVSFYEEYPGMYVPRTLLVRFDRIDSSKDALCGEILRLTKMNWNNCQMDELIPITVRAARQVGDILKHVPQRDIAEHYKFYM